MPNKVNFTRRTFMKSGSVILAAPAILRATTVGAQGAPFKIGIVSPQTGPLSGFGEAEDFVLDGLADTIAGITNNGAPVAIEIIRKDSQSNPNRASEVAQELILNDGVNLILAKDTPDTANPVADQAELNEIPCITTNCPWQPYFFGRGGSPEVAIIIPIIFSGGLRTLSPISRRCGRPQVRRKSWAGCFRTMRMAMPRAIRHWGCRGHWPHRALL